MVGYCAASGEISTVAMTNEERAVEVVAEKLTRIFKNPDDAVSEGMRFRARQIVGELNKQKLLALEPPS